MGNKVLILFLCLLWGNSCKNNDIEKIKIVLVSKNTQVSDGIDSIVYTYYKIPTNYTYKYFVNREFYNKNKIEYFGLPFFYLLQKDNNVYIGMPDNDTIYYMKYYTLTLNDTIAFNYSIPAKDEYAGYMVQLKDSTISQSKHLYIYEGIDYGILTKSKWTIREDGIIETVQYGNLKYGNDIES